MRPDEPLVGVDRVLAILSMLASMPLGATLDGLAQRSGYPKTSVHRALTALVRSGFALKTGRGQYVLGDEFLRLAFTHHADRPEHISIRPVLEQLASRFGETAHFAVLDGDSVVYRAKVDPTVGAVRLNSTIGGRNLAHATAVGKLLLSYRLPDLESVRRWIGTRELESMTQYTLTTAEQLHEQLAEARSLGYSVDRQENATGVNCLAVPVFFTDPSEPAGAVSVSAVAYRTPLTILVDAVDEIRAIVATSTS